MAQPQTGVPAVVDLADPAFWDDPHAVLHRARAACPVAFTTTGDPMILTYDAVQAVLKDPTCVTQSMELITQHGITDGPLYEWWRLAMFNTNPPQHTRLRTLVSRAFTIRRVEDLRPHARALAEEILDAHAGAGRMEVVEDLAHELPIRLIGGMLGIPDEDHHTFGRWSTDLGLMFSATMTPEQHQVALDAINGLNEYTLALIEERRRRPSDDLLSAMVAAEEEGDRLTQDELVAMVVNILFGGHDTSKSMLSIALMLMATHPGAVAQLRADPTLVAGAVEEILRYEPSIPAASRRPTQDLVIGGVTIPAGTAVMPSLIAGNRDPAQFPDPDRFDVTRADLRSLTFGFGVHFCMGAALARLEVQEVLPVVLERCRDLEPVEPARWIPYLAIRRIDEFPVTFRAA